MNQVSTDRWNQLLSDTFTTFTGNKPSLDSDSRLNLVTLGECLLSVGQVAGIRTSSLDGRDDNGLMAEIPDDVTLVRLGWQVDTLAAVARSSQIVAWEATTGETGLRMAGQGTAIDELSKLAMDTYKGQLQASQQQNDETEADELEPPFVTVLLIGDDDVLTAYTDGTMLQIRRMKTESSAWATAEKAAADLHLQFWDHPRYNPATSQWSDEDYGDEHN